MYVLFESSKGGVWSGWAPCSCPTHGGFPKLGVLFRGPNNKVCSILGSILGSPYFGKLLHFNNLQFADLSKLCSTGPGSL